MGTARKIVDKRPDYRNLIITTDHIGTERARDEAYKVVRDLRARCEEFHRFSIADVYDAVGYAGDYTDLLQVADKEGQIVLTSGKVIGKHKGFWHYTIGQRKGLAISAAERLAAL